MAIAHEGLASLAVDLHEVGDLLALTNSLVQLHNLVGGSQVTPNQSRRHHSPRSNKWIWIWWKEDLSGKQLGEG
ncbi:hypothetical protein T12_8696, partial [Trichinella patagoniensis]